MSPLFKCWRGLVTAVVAVIAVIAGAAAVALGAAIYAPDKVRDVLAKIGGVASLAAAILPPTLPAATTVDKAYWLTQNWTARDRYWFHHTTQGTATFPVPYDWFVSLEQPGLSLFGEPDLLKDQAYLGRFGFIPSPPEIDGNAADFGYRGDASSGTFGEAEHARFKEYPKNPDRLPVGFAKLKGGADPTTGETYPAQIGFTCAACHTGHLEYKNVSIRFDGGPAMIDLGKLESAVGLSIAYTMKVPGRFRRFADRVAARVEKPGSPPIDRTVLEKQLEEILSKLMRERELQKEILARGNLDFIDEGFGRLDALNRIGNQVFFSDMLPRKMDKDTKIPEWLAGNFARPDAPVSFPPIWDVPWFLWAQYDASILNPLVRNAGEALGVKSKLNMAVHPDEKSPRFKSSVQLMNIYWFEEMLAGPDPFVPSAPEKFKGLIAPEWREVAEIFKGDANWQIDEKKVAEGRALYRNHCVECHRGPVRDPEFEKQWPDYSFWRAENWVRIGEERYFNVVQKPVADLGTDRQQSRILTERRLFLPPGFNLKPIEYLNRKWDCHLPNDEWLNASFVLSLMNVVDEAIVQWFIDNPTAPDLEKKMWDGARKNCQNQRVFKPIPPSGDVPAKPPYVIVPQYRARPLDGVWATAPYLHNGSVPTLYAMLTPQHERPKFFCVGSREFDPGKVGLPVPAKPEDVRCAAGLTKLDTTQLGNSNLGHSFEGTETDIKKLSPGIIGPKLSDQEREELVEYLKIL